jgi:MFS family permease
MVFSIIIGVAGLILFVITFVYSEKMFVNGESPTSRKTIRGLLLFCSLVFLFWGPITSFYKNHPFWSWVIIIVAIIGVICYLRNSYSKKCACCKQWNAMKETKRVRTGTKATTVRRTEETKNRKGEVIATRDVYLPATKYEYNVYRKCKYCGYEDVCYDSETVEN